MVEWKKLGDVCEIKGRIGFRGYTRKDQVQKGQGAISLSPGNISDGFLSYDSCTYISWTKYEESPEIIVHEGDIILCKTASVGKVARVMGLPEKATINPQLVLIKNITIHPQFLLYILSDYPFQTMIKSLAGVGSVPNVSQAKLSEIQIPIPPLTEQNRIVGILDTFTESIENLKKQITERKKQYEYYRDQLLDLEGKPGVEMMSMGELFTFKNGLNKGKEFFGSGKPIIMFSNVFNSRYLKSSMITNRVDITEKEMERIDAKIGDVFFTRTSETRGDVGYSSVLLEDIGECTFAGFLIRARPLTDKLIPSYCKYCFSSPIIRCSIIGNSSFTTRASLTGSGLGKIDLPIPPLSQQSRIVTILDTFEASIANLEQQLTHRQKQYEYYRNMLLTFDE